MGSILLQRKKGTVLLFAASPVVPLRSNWPTPGYVNLSVLSYFLVLIRTAMCLFEVIYLVVTLAQLLRLIFASFLFTSVNLASFLNDGCNQ